MAEALRSVQTGVRGIAEQAKAAAAQLALVDTQVKNRALAAMAAALEAEAEPILAANAEDLAAARADGLSRTLLDRLALTPARIAGMAAGLRNLAALSDPVGGQERGWRLPNGLDVSRVRVPLGVVAIIYEARPNVTADAAGLCLKSGNACLLRGGKEAIRSNTQIARTIAAAAYAAGIPEGAVGFIEATAREAARELMQLEGLVDVLIPRGGPGLIQSIKENATVPVIIDGSGNCHIYVDASADLAKAEAIVLNAKCQRPSVCNAAETLLVHRDAAADFLPRAAQSLVAHGVELRGCERTRALVPQALPAADADYATEFLELILAIKVVDSVDAAIAHIGRYGTGHSEAIITEDYQAARRFTRAVDAAAVYVNASTRFTDGEMFGFGAEIGISTQKLHARGPLGLTELTTLKYIVTGDGQVRA
ncbi:MAG TPA: glutamate-5-semialdehyde dehydrogenase [Limnochordia bacterium]|nr:glutamate-5-semialdehyde dehydrogenase [Limnochordia bacterium]